MLRLAYIGNHEESLELLLAERSFDVRAVNLNPEFLRPTRNPADELFRRTYRTLRDRPRLRTSAVELALLRGAAPFMTSPFRDYVGYLERVARRGLELVDFDQAEEGARYLREHAIDLLVVNDWWMLAGAVVTAPRLGAVNVHPSILPAYRGSLPTLWSLKNGDAETAVSYMLLSAGMDNGRLIAQHRFPIARTRDPLDLEAQIDTVIRRTLVEDIKAYADGRLRPVPQRKEGASKTAKYDAYRKIAWREERARDVVTKIRYYPHMWPTHSCFTLLDGERLDLWEAAQAEGEARLQPGEFEVRLPRLVIQASDGAVSVNLLSGLRGKALARILWRRRGRFDD